MLALTERQEEIIRDFEAAASYYEQHHHTANTAKNLAERAGYPSPLIYNLVANLNKDGKYQGLERIKAAFDKAGVKSKAINSMMTVKVDTTALAIPEPPQPQMVQAPAMPQQSSDELGVEIEVYTEVIQALRKLKNPKRQQHILSCAKLFYGLNF